MAYKIEPLDMSSLNYGETGNLIKDTIDLYGTTPPLDPHTDAGATESFITKLQSEHALFNQARKPVMSYAATPQIEALDNERDLAVKILRRFIKLGLLSTVPAEVAAANELHRLMKTYEGVENNSYQGETEDLDKLLGEINSKYSAHVATLSLTRYVTQLTNSNNAFKALIKDRSSQQSLPDNYNARVQRQQMLATYRDFMVYLQVMANLPNGSYFAQLLTQANTLRKKLADLVARRKGIVEAQEARAATPAPGAN
jgi:hypothetical protein